MAEGTPSTADVTPKPGAGRGRPVSSAQHELETLRQQQRALQSQLEQLQRQHPPSLATSAAEPATEGQSTSSSASGDSAEVAPITLTVKLPPYWAADPLVWFAQVESLFATRQITREKTMFHHVVSSLSHEFAGEVRDLILNPPDHQPYTVLKRQLIARTQTSEQKRLQQLLVSEELGSRTPTQLLRSMQQLLGENHMDDKLFRSLFVQHLPQQVRLVLASSADDLSLEALAAMADRIVEVSTELPGVQAVSADPAHSAVLEMLQDIRHQLADLSKNIAHLTQHSRYKPRSRSRERSSRPLHTAPATQGATSADSNLCYYHAKFGDQAFRCVPPCSRSSAPPAEN